MLLKQYLKEKKYTQKSFLSVIQRSYGVQIPQATFAKWVTGVRIPRENEIRILYKATEGKVDPNSFYLLQNNAENKLIRRRKK